MADRFKAFDTRSALPVRREVVAVEDYDQAIAALEKLIENVCPRNWGDDQKRAESWIEAARISGRDLPYARYPMSRAALERAGVKEKE